MQSRENTPSHPAVAHQPAKPLSLLSILQVVVERSRMIALVTLAAAVITAVYSLFLPNIYTAQTLILPTQEEKGVSAALLAQMGGLAALAGGGSPLGATVADLYVSLLKSEAVKGPLIDRFRLQEAYHQKYRVNASRVLDSNSVILAGKKDGIVTISVDDKDPRRAAQMADAYVEELGKLVVSVNASGAGQNRAFLEEQLGKAKGDLAKAAEEYKAFQVRNKTVEVGAQVGAAIKGIAELRANLAAEEIKLASYRRQYTDWSQEVKDQRTLVTSLRAQIASLEGRGGNGSIPSLGSVPAMDQENARLMRELKKQEALVEALAKQYEMAKFSEAKSVAPFQVILKAKVPELKSRPSRSKLVLTATFSALVLAVGLAFVLEKFAALPDSDRAQWKRLATSLPFAGKRQN